MPSSSCSSSGICPCLCHWQVWQVHKHRHPHVHAHGRGCRGAKRWVGVGVEVGVYAAKGLVTTRPSLHVLMWPAGHDRRGHFLTWDAVHRHRRPDQLPRSHFSCRWRSWGGSSSSGGGEGTMVTTELPCGLFVRVAIKPFAEALFRRRQKRCPRASCH